LALALPLAIATLGWFAFWQRPTTPAAPTEQGVRIAACLRGFAPLVLIIIIWVTVRLLPTVLIDPASPLILVIGGLVALPMLPTAIAAALSCYVVGGGTIGQVIRLAWLPMSVLLVLALLMLVFARHFTGILT